MIEEVAVRVQWLREELLALAVEEDVEGHDKVADLLVNLAQDAVIWNRDLHDRLGVAPQEGGSYGAG